MLVFIKTVLSLVLTALIGISGLFGMTGEKATGHEDYKEYKNVILMIGDGMGFEQTMLVGSQHPGADYPDDPATFYGYRLPYRLRR